MKHEAVASIFNAIEAQGYEVRFVGGCVRDAIAGRAIADIDIASTSPPKKTLSILNDAGINGIPTALKYGTITAIIDDTCYEITSLRRDRENYGRHALIEFTDNWFEDAKRRDFTFNAMSADRNGVLYDPFNGREDLLSGSVKFIGCPNMRIQEDYLRILRYFRFFGSLSTSIPEPNIIKSCQDFSDNLHTLSGERIRDEMWKILSVHNVLSTLKVMDRAGILKKILPEFYNIKLLSAILKITKGRKSISITKNHSLQNLSALIVGGPRPEVIESIALRWKLSNKEKSRLARFVTPINPQQNNFNTYLFEELYEHGLEDIRSRIIINWAKELTNPGKNKNSYSGFWSDIMDRCEQWRAPQFPLNGRDVMSFGIAQGATVAHILNETKEWWINADFPMQRDVCLAKLKEIIMTTNM